VHLTGSGPCRAYGDPECRSPALLKPTREVWHHFEGFVAQRLSIRVGQAAFGVQFRCPWSSALARIASFRMTAVMATLGGLPAAMRA